MKKNIFTAILLSLTLLLSSCTIKIESKNKGQTSSDVESSISNFDTKEIQLNTQYTLDNSVYFKLIKVSTTPFVYDSMGSGNGYEPFLSSQTYVDLIFEISNKSMETYDCKESMDLTVLCEEYGEETDQAGEFVAENDGWNYLATYSTALVESGETERVHYFVPFSKYNLDQDFNFTLNTTDVTYTFKYNSDQGTLGDVTDIQLGEPVSIEDYANVTLESVSYSRKVVPSNTNRSYTYYETNDSSSTFFILQFTVESLLSEELSCEKWINAVAFYEDEDVDDYYQSSTIIEDVNRHDLDTVGEVGAGETRTLYVVFKVPSSLDDTSACKVEFVINGEFLSYNIASPQV